MAFGGRLKFLSIGDWSADQVVTTAVPDARLRLPEVEAMIDQAWRQTLAAPGTRNLFDGPICRLDHWSATPQQLRLFLSVTSYRIFVGTHLSDVLTSQLIGGSMHDRFGPQTMANPLGVSCALETADGWLLLGRRNDSEAYYPDRIHPFAGSMDPGSMIPDATNPDVVDTGSNRPPNVFDEIRRELREEIGLQPEQLTDIRCVALVEDAALHHPELMFTVRTAWTRAAVEAGLDVSEHHGVEAMRAERDTLQQRLRDQKMTPVALASVALWGRKRFGEDWFSSVTG